MYLRILKAIDEEVVDRDVARTSQVQDSVHKAAAIMITPFNPKLIMQILPTIQDEND